MTKQFKADPYWWIKKLGTYPQIISFNIMKELRITKKLKLENDTIKHIQSFSSINIYIYFSWYASSKSIKLSLFVYLYVRSELWNLLTHLPRILIEKFRRTMAVLLAWFKGLNGIG